MRLGMWMTSCPEAMGWGFWVIFWKKQWVEIWSWMKWVDFWTWVRPVQLWTTGCPHIVGSDGTVSIVEIVSLSPRVEKPKLKEGNKSFVPELKKVVSVSSVFQIPMHVNVLHICIFHIFVSWSYFGEYVTHRLSSTQQSWPHKINMEYNDSVGILPNSRQTQHKYFS